MIKRNLLVMGLAVLLSACGFHLRGTDTNALTVKDMNLSARDAYGPTVTQLRNVMKNSGVNVSASAPYELVLTSESETQRAASYAGAGRSVDYELSTVLSYTIQGRNNAPLLSDKLEVQKIYSYDGNNITGSGQEAAQIRSEMRRELVQKMMSRLQMLSPAQLEQLQAKADERERAEALEVEAARRAQDAQPQQSPLEFPAK
ncbi:hypothetical protein DCO48_06745 [Pseudomonas sp. SDI]|uniref:LPS-assembly lipoprotein LptE n=1 Tax=Pseudomonas sp. SDI TaxID=2170734 RepID=UPI000DE75E58|nr:LPS assembly lipoprotein LptE [Pseudomonas sp. SDI]PWB34392.1 hypothetical protein DCO48_06745 [Pseudomonas sp. SDI]